jgi:ubiquinone/menaquinone biosynthesis C-methylase UbiE
MKTSTKHISSKAAVRGEPSYMWRAGQERRFGLICQAAGKTINGRVLEDGCGVGEYLVHLAEHAQQAIGLDYEFERTLEARIKVPEVVCGAGEKLPFPDNYFDLVLSHEVLEHVQDDQQAVNEIIRVLKPGGRLILFVPNRGYPFETHGIYWKGVYKFGNKFFVNYLPRKWRDKLAPHVRVYTGKDLSRLFASQRVNVIEKSILFGAYDNLINRLGWSGRALRTILQSLEHTPLKILGLSHFWVLEKKPS